MVTDLANRIMDILTPAIRASVLTLIEANLSTTSSNAANEIQSTSQDRDNLDFMIIQEVAIFLRSNPRTIYNFVATGRIPYHKVGDKLLFLRSEIIEWTAKEAEADRSRRQRIVKSDRS